MLFLKRLNINYLRNISKTQLVFHPRINLIQGMNATGKTSLLEAIYLLSMGRSFRTHLPRRIIQRGQDNFVLYGEILINHIEYKLGLSKSLTKGSIIKINGQEQPSIIHNLNLFPVQVINTDSFNLLFSASRVRREFIDWGLFHVKPSFLNVWKKYNQLLKQRNALLRQNVDKNYFKSWDAMLIKSGYELDMFRKEYCALLMKNFQAYKSILPDIEQVDIIYKQGWSKEKSYEQALHDNLESDLLKGYTSHGPHRADINLHINNKPAKDQLSRGQLKLLIAALYMSQSAVLKNEVGISPVLLIDDITAELDQRRLQQFLQQLIALNLQMFITMIDNPPQSLLGTNINYQLFHVEHGNFKNQQYG